MKKIVACGAIVALCLSASLASAQNTNAKSGPNSPTATHDNPSSCLGAERATRNSNGGDRAQGGFGPAQSDYVHYLNDGGTQSYGEWLQGWKAACENAPGN